MSANKNILILSVGTRNKIVQYFKEELNGNGKVFATDCSELAPALYEADEYYIFPKITEKNYLDTIIKICEVRNVDAVLSLIDPELSILSKNKEKFLEVGTTPIVSDFETVEMSLDKFEFNEFLKNNSFNWIKTYDKIDEFKKALNTKEISFPVFIKPKKGSASININKVSNFEETENLFNQHSDLIIQEFMDEKEIGVDVYVDMLSKKVVSIFAKEKIKMRAGETDKSISFNDNKLFALIEDFVSKAGYIGIIDVDVFTKDGKYYISEVNPRFGGGYPHGHEIGVNVPKMILSNLRDDANKVNIGNYKLNSKMMKYNEIKILDS